MRGSTTHGSLHFPLQWAKSTLLLSIRSPPPPRPKANSLPPPEIPPEDAEKWDSPNQRLCEAHDSVQFAIGKAWASGVGFTGNGFNANRWFGAVGDLGVYHGSPGMFLANRLFGAGHPL